MKKLENGKVLYTLREARKRSLLSVDEVAKKLGKNSRTIYSWEKGVNKPRMKQLLRLLEVYELTIEDIYFENENFNTYYREQNENKKYSLKEARIRSGFTVADIAKKTGKHRQTVYDWENGVNYPSYSVLQELANIYEMNISEFDLR